jgi:uncharacterized membrane protein YtjA (UPF0391 family)
MLRASISFFLIGLLAIALGANNVAGLSIEFGKILLFVFLALSILSFGYALLTGKRAKSLE